MLRNIRDGKDRNILPIVMDIIIRCLTGYLFGSLMLKKNLSAQNSPETSATGAEILIAYRDLT